jgi:protein-S-isoprenylcysteine O-methyltransferase Ste14
MDEIIQKETEKIKKGTVHFLLVHSYLMFLGAIILGVLFDTLLKEKIFSSDIYQWVGFFMLVFSSLVIFWAQKTSMNYKKNINKNENKSHFESGPYQYLRSPTHFGLFIMTLGFGLIINSLFTVIFIILGYTISKLFFLKKEERLLESKYGQVYSDYKKKVKNWI